MLIIPFRESISISGIVSQSWLDFFRDIKRNLEPMGEEKSFKITNNTSTAAVVTGLSFNKESISCALVDLLIQRVTSTNEEVEVVTFTVHYLPDSESWVLSSGPTTAGITLTIDSSGQVKYTSSNLTGDEEISRMVWRARTLEAKSSIYSKFNGRGNL